MIFWLLYPVIGLLFACIAEVDGNRLAITYLAFALLFMVAWPIIFVYMAYMLATCGVLKYKGKVIWRAKSK